MMIPIWRTKDGRLIPVNQMSESHLRNSINLILRSGGRWRGDQLNGLLIELEIRRITGR
jgi:hypothetical protein